MKHETFTFKDGLGEDIYGYRWEPEGKPIGIVQFIHGMTEHAGRYEELAKILTAQGYLCIAEDHHGHGYTAPTTNKLGILPSDWKEIANDIHAVSKIVKKEYPDLELFIIGNSWGSYLAQYYIEKWGSEISGCILVGTSGAQPNLKFIRFFSTMMSFFKKDSPGKFLAKRLFGIYNQHFKPIKTDFDWFSSDSKEVDKFIKDPRTGFIPSNGFFRELAKLLLYIWDTKNERKIPKNLPIYIMAGKEDSVSFGTHLISPLIKRYEDYGIKDVSWKYYSDARHDIFHELNRKEVFEDLLKWIEKKSSNSRI